FQLFKTKYTMKQLLSLLLTISAIHFMSAQQIDTSKYPPLTTFTAQEDHANMMQQLGITEVRPGKSGDPTNPNSANYDESIANPCPELPEILVTNNGKKVTTADMWWNVRRPEIVEMFEREVYGRVPENVPDVTWEVEIVDNERVGRIPVIAKKLVG